MEHIKVRTRIIKAHEISEPLPRWTPPPRPPGGATAAGGPRADRAATSGVSRPDPEELERLRAAAREEGLAEGMRVAEQAYRAKHARVEAVAAALDRERREFFDRIEPELVRLALAIAEKVIGQEMELRPELVVDLVRGAMKRLRGREALRVRVNPRDLARVREAREDLLAAVDGVRKLDILDDRRVGVGGCVIESPNGTLDARIRTQLEEIGRALEAALPEPGAEGADGP